MRKQSLALFAILAIGCGDGTLVVDDGGDAVVATNNGSTSAVDDGSNGSGGTAGPVDEIVPDEPDEPANTNNATTAQTTGDTGGTNTMTTGETTGPQFNQMFVAVADFMREKCVNCHNAGQNGNFVIPAADTPNETVRMNLEGVVARSGRLLITPNNTAESQVYIMITNAAGEQFPPETIAIVADWINAGAPYDQ